MFITVKGIVSNCIVVKSYMLMGKAMILCLKI